MDSSVGRTIDLRMSFAGLTGNLLAPLLRGIAYVDPKTEIDVVQADAARVWYQAYSHSCIHDHTQSLQSASHLALDVLQKKERKLKLAQSSIVHFSGGDEDASQFLAQASHTTRRRA